MYHILSLAVDPSGCMIIDDANEGGALGSNIWALRGRLDSVEVLVLLPAPLPLVIAEGVAAEGVDVTGFKSLPVNMLEAKETLGGKLGGMGVESVMVESLLECCLWLFSRVLTGVASLKNDTGMMGM